MYAGTRAGDAASQEFARSLGAAWSGDAMEGPPIELDAVIIFAPTARSFRRRSERCGREAASSRRHSHERHPIVPVRAALGRARPRFVANLTRADGEAFLALAPTVPIHTEVEPAALADANAVLNGFAAVMCAALP